ncbi:MAG: hypothetical protein ACSLEM_03060 [Candidatus Malihini olakiniferum]
MFAKATLISVKASAIHPTQPAIGKAKSLMISRIIAKNRALFSDFCKVKEAGKVIYFSNHLPSLQVFAARDQLEHTQEVKSVVIVLLQDLPDRRASFGERSARQYIDTYYAVITHHLV